MKTNIYEILCDGVRDAIEAESLEKARELAADWLREGVWDTTGGTIWVRAHLRGVDEDGDNVDERVTVRIDPKSPACTDGAGMEHDWQSPHEILGGLVENPGVWGHGGGVIIREVCMRCGCERTTDTWAQDPSTGEQGLESVNYVRGKYRDEIEVSS